MTGKLDTRGKRGYTFTFESEEEKEEYHQHAKRRGLTLAGLIKSLLAADKDKYGAASPPKE